MSAKQLSPQAIGVLKSIQVEGNVARITAGQLTRDLYVEVNKCLEALGGDWNRKVRGHVFSADPRKAILTVIQSGGEFRNPKAEYGVFETPAALAAEIVSAADIRAGHRVLEPSSGRGALLRAMAMHIPISKIELTVVEILEENCKALEADGWKPYLVQADFLSFAKGEYDRIVMNPTFEKQADIDHVEHAYQLLAPGGRIVSVMSAGVKYRRNRKTEALRGLIKRCGKIEDLPERSFHESGTDWNTVLVTLQREDAAVRQSPSRDRPYRSRAEVPFSLFRW